MLFMAWILGLRMKPAAWYCPAMARQQAPVGPVSAAILSDGITLFSRVFLRKAYLAVS
jgi:hypothetical protein